MNIDRYIDEQHTNETKGLVQKEYSIIFNSNDSIATPLNPTTFNNEYTITLNNGIGVPASARTCSVGLIGAKVWNYDQNIRAPNNKFYFKPDAGSPFVFITIPAGYYGLSELSSQIALQLQLAGYPSDLFNFQGDSATQRVVITFNYAGTQIDFNPDDSIRTILGFDPRLSPPALSTVGQPDVSDGIAIFNSVNTFLISCPALCDDGININSIGASILGEVDVTAPPNNLISFQPNQVAWIDVPGLIGSNRSDITFKLLNEIASDVFVLDPFSFSVTIRWWE